jgi:hypothetical protein
VPRDTSLVQQLDDGSVEAHRDRQRCLAHHPRARGVPPPALARPVGVPGAGHPHVAVQDRTIAEPDQQVLAAGLDGLDP